MKAVILSMLTLCACGPDAYTTQGIPVYVHDRAYVNINELSAAIDITEFTVEKAHSNTTPKFARFYRNNFLVIHIERLMFRCGETPRATGCYQAGMIQLTTWGKGECVGNSSIAHEMMHFYKSEMDDGDLTHSDKLVFGEEPPALEEVAQRAIKYERCGIDLTIQE